MRRVWHRLIVVLIAVLAIAAGWSVWLAWNHPSLSIPGVTLTVNHRTALEVVPGTPLALEISIGSSPSAPAFEIGHRWRAWHTLIRLETVRGDDIASMARVGPSRSLHMMRQADGRLRLTEDSSPVAHLEAGRHVHTLTFVIDPEAASAIKIATYSLRAVVETPFWMPTGWRGRGESVPVTIVVRDPSRDDKSGDLAKERLARTADFYLGANRFADALGAATALLDARPQDPESHVLLGDALAGLARRPEALAAYRQALALSSRAYEQPDLIMARIRSIADGGNR